MRPTSVLATVTGRDRPGVTAAFFAALAAHDVDIRDVEQVVIRDRLILTVLLEVHGDTAPLRNSVTRAAGALGMDCEMAVAEDGDAARPVPVGGNRIHVIVLGHPLRAGAIGHIAQRIADSGGNIETVTQLSTDPVSALELVVRSPDAAALRTVLLRAAGDTGVDVAFEPAALRRKAKRLVLLSADAVLTVVDSDQLVPGAAAFVQTLRRLGYRLGAVGSGSRIGGALDLDFAVPEDLDGAAKAEALTRFAEKSDVPISQTVAVGDGTHDLAMLERAGLGIAFNARAPRRMQPEPGHDAPYFDSVLMVLGAD